MGYPSSSEMYDLFMAVQEGGADILEVGIPFSDPVADGPVIQQTSKKAIDAGMTLKKAFEMLKDFRSRGFHLPVVLMGYANPFLAYGEEKLIDSMIQTKVSGVIIPDLPPSESLSLNEKLRSAQIDQIFFVAPTTPEKRIKKIAELSSGFIYCISTKGVTGADQKRTFTGLSKTVAKIKAYTDTPVCVGFGISNEKQISEVCALSDGAIMASRLLKDLEKTAPSVRSQTLLHAVKKFKKATFVNP